MAASLPEAWIRALRTSPLLHGLGDEALARLEADASELRLAPGEVLVRQGAAADALYLVLEGRFAAELERETGAVRLNEVGRGEVVGELALILGGPRSSTVRCLEEGTVLVVPGGTLRAWLDRDPALVARFDRLLAARLRRMQLASFVNDLFGPLGPEILEEIEREVEWVTLPAGGVLFRQGDDAADGVYVVLGGRVRVLLEDGGDAPRIVAEVGRGEPVGEMALLGGGVRSATVCAVRDTELARMSRESFERLLERHPGAMLHIARLLVARLQRATLGVARPRRLLRTLAVVPASPEVPIGAFAERLAAALARLEPALWLGSERVDAALGRAGIAQLPDGDPGSLRLTQWLLEQESAHATILLEADPRWTPWTQRALRQADHVLVVGDARADPSPGEIEVRLDEGRSPDWMPRRSLVLIQPEDGRTWAGTDRWLARRAVEGPFHVRMRADEDFARLARLLTGRGIGLVLGGGGARGFAHIGVLRALREIGIPVDAIGGTSMGALVAGCHALGHEPGTVAELCRRHTRRLLDPTLPMVSLLAGHRTGSAFRQVFGARRIEDLPLPYFCVSTNLTRAEEVVHRRGSLARAIRASVSLPGILPPVAEAGDLLIDGGLLNNVPVDVMSLLTGGGPTVAVDVSPDVDLRAEIELSTELSGWRVLWSRLSPFSARMPVPSILSLLGRSVVVGSIVSQRERLARRDDVLYLLLPVGRFGLLEFAALDAIAEAGLEAARGPLADFFGRPGAGRTPNVR